MAQQSYRFREELDLGEPEWYAETDGLSDDLGDVLRESLDEAYAGASPEELDQALAGVLGSMSPAEAFSFTKALKQIQRGAGQITSDPAFGQIAGTVLPIAGGALGAVIGGPAGTALGTSLGTTAAKALPGAKRPVPAPVAGGSAAAARGLVLTQQPDVLRSLLALALGQHGQQSVSGVPIASVMSMLSSVFGQAAADADELAYLSHDVDPGELEGTEDLFENDPAESASIYDALLDADNHEVAEALEAW